MDDDVLGYHHFGKPMETYICDSYIFYYEMAVNPYASRICESRSADHTGAGPSRLLPSLGQHALLEARAFTPNAPRSGRRGDPEIGAITTGTPVDPMFGR